MECGKVASKAALLEKKIMEHSYIFQVGVGGR